MTNQSQANGIGRVAAIVSGVAAAVVAAALAAATLRTIRESAQTLSDYREVQRLRQEWRTFVGECPAGKTWRVVDKAFRAGPLSASVEGSGIRLLRDVGETFVPLPCNMRAEFAVDTVGGKPLCAVLTLRWSGSRGRTGAGTVVSVAACRKPPADSRLLRGHGVGGKGAL